MDESDDFFDRAVKAYFIYRLLWACFGLAALILGGVCVIFWWIYNELSLEFSYQQRYGATWQSEFERYHGTLSHAHTQLGICVGSILAIVVVLSWFCHQTFHRHRRHRHEHYEA
jgi:hypothetical protein